jgi:hypothetical protein
VVENHGLKKYPGRSRLGFSGEPRQKWKLGRPATVDPRPNCGSQGKHDCRRRDASTYRDRRLVRRTPNGNQKSRSEANREDEYGRQAKQQVQAERSQSERE